jgi:hypothetical protein
MSYYHRFARRPKPVTIGTAKVKNMIDTIDGVNGLTDWERKFIDSIKEGWQKYGSVTEKQHGMIQKLADRYNPQNIKARKDWNSNFDSDKRKRLQIMSRYYKANPPYFSDLATRALEDPDYIPTERAYVAMCENKYAQKVIATHEKDPEFPSGGMAVGRNSRQAPRSIRGKTVIVIEHPPGVHNAANNAKRVIVLPVGESEPVETEERWLKKLPKKLR